jgi:hypothetical protein
VRAGDRWFRPDFMVFADQSYSFPSCLDDEEPKKRLVALGMVLAGPDSLWLEPGKLASFSEETSCLGLMRVTE